MKAANRKSSTNAPLPASAADEGDHLDARLWALRSAVRCIQVQISEGSGVLPNDVAFALMHIADSLDWLGDECHGMRLPKTAGAR